ncbi:MAG: DUF4240 domain-containing protein [Candidatus Thiodiazotropha sp. (ex. Lucinoma kazani)]|nr:DUF4240 domain-containing protein [Candidatus Thiodiazotropha sp. (ex Lucinoma borealis)]
MTKDEFWELIKSPVGEKNPSGQLEEKLKDYGQAEIKDFYRHFDKARADLDITLMRAAFYHLFSGCGDDLFNNGCHWIIASGKGLYEQIKGDPDKLADIDIPSEDTLWDYEGYGYASHLELIDEVGDLIQVDFNGTQENTSGEKWDIEDEAECRVRLPEIHKKIYGR